MNLQRAQSKYFGISCICAVKLYVNLGSLSNEVDSRPEVDSRLHADSILGSSELRSLFDLPKCITMVGRTVHITRWEEQFTRHGGKNNSHHTAGRTVHITQWEEQFTLHGGKNKASTPLRYTVIVRMDAGYAGRENKTYSPIKSPM